MIDDIFLLLISNETHIRIFCLILQAHITKQNLFTEWQRAALCHLASLFCAVCRPSIHKSLKKQRHTKLNKNTDLQLYMT